MFIITFIDLIASHVNILIHNYWKCDGRAITRQLLS